MPPMIRCMIKNVQQHGVYVIGMKIHTEYMDAQYSCVCVCVRACVCVCVCACMCVCV